MFNPPPTHSTWVEIELEEKDENGKQSWKGIVENYDDTGVTLGNGLSSAGGFHSTAHIPIKNMKGWKPITKDEEKEFYVGQI